MGRMYVTINDIADECRCSAEAVRDAVRAGELPPPTWGHKPQRWHVDVLREHALLRLRSILANETDGPHVQTIPRPHNGLDRSI